MDGIVRLTNISDFITPNLDCVIPLETTVKETEKKSLVSLRKRELVANASDCADKEKKQSIKISLADCLACNGCITSAETVLIEQQSLSKVWEGIDGKKLSVVTVSPQAVCSIAAKKNISPEVAARLISSYFLQRGVTYVVDSSFGRQLSLSLLSEELHSRPSTSRPVLSSACPGFVCYAEKSHGKLLVPLISNIRSPQAIQGALVKNYLALKHGFKPQEIFHVAVMPCFDKKLEASREQFSLQDGVRETDCVVSTAELYEELEQTQILSANSLPEGWLGDFSRGVLIGGKGGTSGGYAETVVENFVRNNGGIVEQSRLNKNMDVVNVKVDNETKLKVARVYGFRNIQNLVRKLKTGKGNYDFIEIMACPGGCGSGGGQVRETTGEQRDRQLEKVEQLYEQLQGDARQEMKEVTAEWEKLNKDWKSLLMTSYQEVTTSITQKLNW